MSKTARDAGVNLAFFSGNEIFGKTRWENDHRTRCLLGDDREPRGGRSGGTVDGHMARCEGLREGAAAPKNALRARASPLRRRRRFGAVIVPERCDDCASGGIRRSPRLPPRKGSWPTGFAATSGMRIQTTGSRPPGLMHCRARRLPSARAS